MAKLVKYNEITEKSDCDILFKNAEDTLSNLGNCFEYSFDDKKTKLDVVGSIFGFVGSLTKLTFNATGCAIKNAPKAVVAVASTKRELVTAIEEEIQTHQKQLKEDALNEKIKQLRLKV